ncbi:MAG: nucleotidyltransferase domain-containing protein [Candidatus Omnitrophica bacterium]|nr:nucleotidyltransferase domain-containing protein [Candidatus Omnitrophota bacterium]MBU1128186.1 nucleotidyltransferase domain-containing protein [Candidatus Omnitrophota bacterium]MBU1785190.1 nucleotidyltransferase domain-containing protein [Candidatus Omnitrophota bacterium]MBU1852103.1 nucleotidyltransferase domain-containing protein [Candidatus Omnitrophota bacterium]
MPVKSSKETKLKKQILEIIFKYISRETCTIFLFGSFAQKEIYPSSDIDVGLISDKALKNSILIRIKEGLGDVNTLRDIDITDFSSIQDKNFLRIALKETKIWHQTKKSRACLDNLKKRIAG